MAGPQGDGNFDEGSGDPFQPVDPQLGVVARVHRGRDRPGPARRCRGRGRRPQSGRRDVHPRRWTPAARQAGPVGDWPVACRDQVKEHIVDGLRRRRCLRCHQRGQRQHRRRPADATRMQALAAMVERPARGGRSTPTWPTTWSLARLRGRHQFDVQWLRDHWPADAANPTDAELRDILQNAGSEPGLTGDAYSWVDTDWDALRGAPRATMVGWPGGAAGPRCLGRGSETALAVAAAAPGTTRPWRHDESR